MKEKRKASRIMRKPLEASESLLERRIARLREHEKNPEKGRKTARFALLALFVAIALFAGVALLANSASNDESTTMLAAAIIVFLVFSTATTLLGKKNR